MTLFKPPIPWEQMPHEVSENWTASAPFLARDESSRQMLMSKSEFTRVYEFPVEEEVVRFIMWTSRGHDWGPLPDFPGAIVLRRQVSVGGFRRHELALAGTLSALFTRFRGVSGRKWVCPALRWANNKKRTQRQFAGRHPQTREACACLSVIQPVIQRTCVMCCFETMPSRVSSCSSVSPSLCFSPRCLTCPLPSPLTSPVPDPPGRCPPVCSPCSPSCVCQFVPWCFPVGPSCSAFPVLLLLLQRLLLSRPRMSFI